VGHNGQPRTPEENGSFFIIALSAAVRKIRFVRKSRPCRTPQPGIAQRNRTRNSMLHRLVHRLDEARTEWDVVVLYKLIYTTVHQSGLFLRFQLRFIRCRNARRPGRYCRKRRPWPYGHRLERLGFAADHRPHSSSASRFTAGAFGLLLLIQSGERPERRDTLSLGCPVLSRCLVARRHLQVEPDI
jgi:hypothetical protein